jgi:hypothetical protein
VAGDVSRQSMKPARAGQRIMISAVMVVHNNEEGSLTRLLRDLLPALCLLRPLLDAELIIVDNSVARLDRMANAVLNNGVFDADYRWQGGQNLMYGPSLNLAVSLASHPYLLYACANHGQSFDPTWPWDLLQPLLDDGAGKVAMAGSLQPSGAPANFGFPASLPTVHVQGGVFAARSELLRLHPYPGGRYAHWGSDIYQSFQLMEAGFDLAEVPTVKSVWRGTNPGDGAWKYVHRGG